MIKRYIKRAIAKEMSKSLLDKSAYAWYSVNRLKKNKKTFLQKA